jgi:hypothetical protein
MKKRGEARKPRPVEMCYVAQAYAALAAAVCSRLRFISRQTPSAALVCGEKRKNLLVVVQFELSGSTFST